MTPPESTCWECHGTGTSLGDPIEVGAARKVQVKMQRPEPLMMSTSKSNIGHLEGGAAMAGMVKCVLQVSYSGCFSSLHVRQLNAHLEYEAFAAFFETELSSFKYLQGHSQVTSLGFGGSNGHAVFWGKKFVGQDLDINQQIRKRLAKMSPPEVRVLGDNPDDWETDGPDHAAKPGDTFKIEINAIDPLDAPIRWIKNSDVLEDAEEDEDAFFSITGNFNDWEDDRMALGTVPGQHVSNITVPPDGRLEFRFLRYGDVDKVVCPSIPQCTRKSREIWGPSAGLNNNWLIRAESGTEFQVELLCLKGEYSVLWFRS